MGRDPVRRMLRRRADRERRARDDGCRSKVRSDRDPARRRVQRAGQAARHAKAFWPAPLTRLGNRPLVLRRDDLWLWNLVRTGTRMGITEQDTTVTNRSAQLCKHSSTTVPAAW